MFLVRDWSWKHTHAFGAEGGQNYINGILQVNMPEAVVWQVFHKSPVNVILDIILHCRKSQIVSNLQHTLVQVLSGYVYVLWLRIVSHGLAAKAYVMLT